MTSDESWSNKLRTVGDIERPDHYYLNPGDECAFFGEYTARKGWRHSTTNGIITNLKKSVEKRGTAEWQYKERAIAQVAALIRANLAADVLPTAYALFFETEDTPQYFGYDGEYNQIMVKTERTVKSFWDIASDDIQLLAMHGSVLLDVDKMTATYQAAFTIGARALKNSTWLIIARTAAGS